MGIPWAHTGAIGCIQLTFIMLTSNIGVRVCDKLHKLCMVHIALTLHKTVTLPLSLVGTTVMSTSM